MKIAIIAQFPMDVLDGEMAGRGAGQLATWLPQLAMEWDSQRDFEIHWCVLGHKSASPRTGRKWGQTFHWLPCPGISISMLAGRRPQELAFKNLFGRIRPDLVHCWGTESLHGAALEVFRGPSILSMQGIIHALHKTGDLKGWRWILFKRWERLALRRAAMVTSESQWGLDRVNEIVKVAATRKIEYGVFPSFYEVGWNPSPRQPEFLFAGGLSRLKGVDILEAMLQRHPRRKWKMVFAGSGPLEQRLRALNDPQVEVLGTISTQALQERMARAWALVHPSRGDTSPNVVKEARVVGLPVVASPHGGHAEYVDHGRDGFLVDSGDPDAWFAVLDALGNDHDRCRELGAARHGFYREHFRPEQTAVAFLQLYREMLGSDILSERKSAEPR
jgi:glycosyltransferase involved in cell wall biosynthesis